MPAYDYQCPKCDYIVEHHHKMTEDPIYLCRNCIEKLNQVPGMLHKIYLKSPSVIWKDGKPT